jgi:hypothetical protein
MPYLKVATDAPFGLLPDAAPLRIREYVKAATTTIFGGDIVTMLSTGLVDRINDAWGILGPVVGVAAETTLSASAGTTIALYDHPDQLFVCQEDSVGTAIAQTHVGNSFGPVGLIPTGTANLARNRSILQMDTSTTTATGAQMLQFLGLHPVEGTTYPSASSSPRKVIVKINPGFHFFASPSAGI